MSDPGGANSHRLVRVEFADERFTPEEAGANQSWRLPTDYERSILDRLLEVDFPGRPAVAAEARDCRVRQMDRCGCIEFQSGAESDGELAIVAEGSGPRDEHGAPIEVMLTLRAGHLLWLEFHRYGGPSDFRPPARAFEVVPWGSAPRSTI